jgi:tRNA(Ile)-lysidine synthase
LRHDVLPILERDLQPAIVEHLGRLAGMAREDEAFWAAFVGCRLQELVRREGDRRAIRCADLLAPLPWSGAAVPEGARSAVTRRLVRGIVQELRGDCRELTAHHVERVMHLASTHSSGRRVELPGIVAERSFEWMWFSVAEQEGRDMQRRDPRVARGKRANLAEFSLAVTLGAPGESTVIDVPSIRRRFRLKVIDWPQSERDTRGEQGVLDRDLLGLPLVLRNWRPGDSFRPEGRRSTHKLKRFLQASRVGLRDRAGWPVLTSREALVWARGLPPAAEFSSRKGTRAGVVIAEEEL